ncbi:hypothetical protein [Bacillus sp. 165]|uniref:hypothetical protein n=1 Tax=Bacillus sp. 165 TaxID=1529117 RepID=UPI001ADBD0AA|nr:hypothetical protein [Bacillus sp. 165]MBO9131454.1 hypothetical protein [Bacillus sp. 165]
MEEIIGNVFRAFWWVVRFLLQGIVEALICDLLDWPINRNPSNKKLAHRLKSLEQEDWFRDLYAHKQYRDVIYTNIDIRSYLGKKRNIERLKQDGRERSNLIRRIKEEAVYFTSSY